MSGRPIRVLQVIPGLAPRYGGPSQVVTALSSALIAHGVEVRIASTDADGPGRLEVPLGQPTTYAGVPAVFFARRGGEGFKYSPALARWLRDSVRDYDVVHVHAVFSHSSIAAARACRVQGVPYVLRPLGTLAPWALEQKRWQKRALLGLVGHRMIEGAAAVHYTTEAEARQTESTVGPTRGIVVPLGLGEEWFAQPPVPDTTRAPIVVVLSRLHPVKNLEAAIEAFHRLGPAAAGWRMVVAGDGDATYRARLESTAARGPAGDRITFAGWVSPDEARNWFARASLFLQPSHQESFGVAVLEAMASGLPVVVTSGVSLADEVARTGAGWVSTPDVDGLTATLAEAIADVGERRRRGQAARATAARFTWSSAAASLAGVYERLSQAAVSRGTPPAVAPHMNRAS